jgi:hypothetical protein
MIERARAVKNVVELQSIFPTSFAVYGTALGSLREKNVIEHDPDADIGVFSDDFSWAGVNEAIRRGFVIEAVFGSRYYGMEITFIRNGVKTDLMLFYTDPENPGKRFNCLWENGGKDGIKNAIVHEYDEALFAPVHGTLGDATIRTLGEAYVEKVYGENWRTPIKEWDWRTDHLCKKTG